MRRIAPSILLFFALMASAQAELSSEATTFLKEIGLDPASPRVKAVAEDSVPGPHGNPINLEELARRKDAFAVRRFIATRNFLHAYEADPNTRIPSADDYESSYLSAAERALVRPAFRRAGDELYRNVLKQKK